MPDWGTDGYRGTVAVGASVPELGDEANVTALDLWSHGFTIRGNAVDHLARRPALKPMAWTFVTDLGTTHLFHGGGIDGLSWDLKFRPELPAEGRGRSSLFVADEPGTPDRPPARPARPELTVPLPARLPVRRAPAVVDLGPPQGRPAVVADPPEPGALPTRTIPVATALDGLGRDLVVLAIDAHPTWFALHVGGGGALGELPRTRDDPSLRMMLHLWAGEDDQGGQYRGTVRTTGSGFPWIATAVLSPGLDPNARRLCLDVPGPLLGRGRDRRGPPPSGRWRGSGGVDTSACGSAHGTSSPGSSPRCITGR